MPPQLRQAGFQIQWLERLQVWAIALVFSLAQCRHVLFFFGPDFMRAVDAEKGVLDGLPHWRYYQSRVLGPVTEYVLTLFGYSLPLAHVIVAVATLFLTGVIMYKAGRALRDSRTGWTAFFALHALFAMMMSRPWLYIWDYFILLFGTIFLFLVIARAPWWSFLLLMEASFLNHETSFFIGVYMIAKAVLDAKHTRQRPNMKWLGGGVFGVAFGLALIELLRNTLLKREIGWEIFSDVKRGPVEGLDSYFHIQLFANFEYISDWLSNPDPLMMFLIPLTLVVMLGIAISIARRHRWEGYPLAIYALTLFLIMLLLGMGAETRSMLNLVPFLCLGTLIAATPEWSKPKPDILPASVPTANGEAPPGPCCGCAGFGGSYCDK